MPPTLVDGRVYVGSFDGVLYCLNATDGELVWKADIADGWIHSTPLVAEGRVYFGTGAGHLHCVSAMAGAICPPPPIRWRPDGSCIATVIGGDLYAIATDGSRAGWLKYDQRDGRATWPARSPDGQTLLWPDSRGRGVQAAVAAVSDTCSITVQRRYGLGSSKCPHPDDGLGRLMWVTLAKRGGEPGIIEVYSRPAGAKLYLNGELTGAVTPAVIELAPGNCQIGIQPLLGKMQERSVIVESRRVSLVEFYCDPGVGLRVSL